LAGLVCAAALLNVTGSAQAQEFAKVGTFGVQFLKIGVGSRGIAMGESYVALSDNGAEAVFWNPAGLEYVEGNSVMLSHTEWLADIRYDAAAVARSLGIFGTVGLSFAMLGSGPMDVTTVDQQEGTGETFDTADYMVGLSFARALTDKFRVGFNFKYIRERLENESASTYAIDIGTMYYSGFRSLRMGMAIRNFGPEVQLSGSYFDYDNGIPLEDKSEYEPFHLPLAFQFGLALDLLNLGSHRLIGAAELMHPPDNLERINLGAEYVLMKFLALRGGYSFRHDIRGPSFGLGIDYGLSQATHFRLDYAYTDFGILDMVQRVTLGIDF
jgi:hypothetical protein